MAIRHTGFLHAETLSEQGLFLLLPSVLAVALGCTSSAGNGSPDMDGSPRLPDVAGDGKTDIGTTIQDASQDSALDAVGGGGDVQSMLEAGPEGGQDTSPSLSVDASSTVCSDLQTNGPVVHDISNISSPAAGGYNGGTILDGTYDLTDILEYSGPNGTLGIEYGTKQRTIRISNNATQVDLVWVSVPARSPPSPATTNASGTISLAPPMMTITLTCGVNATFSYYYTAASESELVLYFWDATNTGETVFTYHRRMSGPADGGSVSDSGNGSS